MIKRQVICERCGAAVEKEHPDRITIYNHKDETYKDHWGKEHTKSVYPAVKTLHLCEKCEVLWDEFWKGNKDDRQS